MRHHFPGLLKDKTAAGTTRWRVRVEGQPNRKVRIPCGPGEPGFHEHYYAARAGDKLETVKPEKAKRGTLDAMCDEFLKWMEGQVEAGNLSQLTLNSRRTGLNQACETKDPDGDRIGSLDADLPREAFVHIRDAFGGRTGAAATCLKALRAAYKWGKDRGYPANSPVFGVESGHRPKGGATSWSSDDVKKFLEAHGSGTMARLWFCLAYATHGRIGDAPFLGPGNEAMHDGIRYIEWQPRKRGSAFVSLPLDDMLAEELAYHEPRETYLATEYGKPFASSGSLDNRVRKWIVAAGLVGKDGKANRSQHGIRKGVAEIMAENGATEYELMSAFGWTEAKTAGIYTKKFQRRGAAAAASKRLAGAQVGPRSENRGPVSDLSASKIKEK
jgi:integrase